MADEKNSVILSNLAALAQPENFQKYILGTKGNGQPRAVYDVVKDYTRPKKKKKKHKKQQQIAGYPLYLTTSKKKKKKKKKHKNRNKYWHI